MSTKMKLTVWIFRVEVQQQKWEGGGGGIEQICHHSILYLIPQIKTLYLKTFTKSFSVLIKKQFLVLQLHLVRSSLALLSA